MSTSNVKLSDELRALVGLVKFHRAAGTAAFQAAKQLCSSAAQPQPTQPQPTPQLIVRIPLHVSKFSSDPRYLSNYGYRGMKPYEQCAECNRKFQIQPSGFFGKAHNKYCDGVPSAIRKLRRRRAAG